MATTVTKTATTAAGPIDTIDLVSLYGLSARAYVPGSLIVRVTLPGGEVKIVGQETNTVLVGDDTLSPPDGISGSFEYAIPAPRLQITFFGFSMDLEWQERSGGICHRGRRVVGAIRSLGRRASVAIRTRGRSTKPPIRSLGRVTSLSVRSRGRAVKRAIRHFGRRVN